MADNQIRMPSSQGGLVRYYEDYKSKIEFKPEHIVFIIIVVIVIEILLHSYGSGILGI